MAFFRTMANRLSTAGKRTLKVSTGKRIRRPAIVLAVDDYGAVANASRERRDECASSRRHTATKLQQLDAMETRVDLERLFDLLRSVHGADGRAAVLSAYCVVANPDFDRILEDPSEYAYEPVTSTFMRLASEQPAAYRGAWELWREGVDAGLVRPQFHGREHLNVSLFEHLLTARDAGLMNALKAHSIAGVAGDQSAFPGIKLGHAFAPTSPRDRARHETILNEGLDLFRHIYGFVSRTFTPPGQKIHPELYRVVEAKGVEGISKPFFEARALGDGSRRRELNLAGRGRRHLNLIRNVVFEPMKEKAPDAAVPKALAQMERAFRWRQPAIVSSHRANFSSHIDPDHGAVNLSCLGELLSAAVRRWPDAIFLSADALVDEYTGAAR